MFLDEKTFKNVIQHAPLISIDLVIENDRSEFLVGRRNNRPARGFWFVPGGRILKDETLDNGFSRLTKNEIGVGLMRKHCTFLGIFEHFYNDNFFSEQFSTHYIVLAYKLFLDKSEQTFPLEQHDDYQWMSSNEIINHNLVHFNTKAYFMDL